MHEHFSVFMVFFLSFFLRDNLQLSMERESTSTWELSFVVPPNHGIFVYLSSSFVFPKLVFEEKTEVQLMFLLHNAICSDFWFGDTFFNPTKAY